ncbi:MAG: PAS domain-containing sensor histidine kinase [Halobacteria archaeon]|nr:PAS domain-containing sensor histidine kinase [Halobacteria archaeon]
MPLARDFIVQEIDSGVIVLDSDDRIVDINTKAKEVIGSDEKVIGREISDVVDLETVLGFEDDEKLEEHHEETWINTPEGEKCFEINVTLLRGRSRNRSRNNEESDGGTVSGKVVLIHDITERKRREEELKERERDLQLMKDVQSRFLRHNIRNELNVSRGYVNMVAEEAEDYREELKTAAEMTQRVIERSEKTREIEKILEGSGNVTTKNLTPIVEEVVNRTQKNYPHAEFEVEHLPAETMVNTTEYIDTAIEDIVENAVVHNDSEIPQVRVSLNELDDWIHLTVEDNGPGIPQQEIDVLDTEEETDLQHGSGIGLWLVKWAVKKSNGELEFDVDSSGTTVTIKLHKADSQDGDGSMESDEEVEILG